MSSPQQKVLSTEQLNQFRLNGHLTVEDVLSAEEVEALGTHADLIASGAATHIPEESLQLEPTFREGTTSVADRVMATRKLFNLAVYDDLLWGHATNPKVVAIISDLLGTQDIKMYGDQMFMKSPEVGTAQPWHQDSASWRDIFPMDLVTAWTAIDHATPENGCLNFVPGTHRWGMVSGERLKHFEDDLGSAQWPAVPTPLRPGSISFHHSLTIHASSANTSAKRRRGYAIHYMRAASWQDPTVTDAPDMPTYRQVSGQSFPGRV
jgi:phytanoyl-CoA hydroxylase